MTTSQDAATERGHVIQASGVNFHYEEHGHGQPVVLLHAGTLTAEMWQPYLAAFAEHYRVITPDMRGHGRSDNPKGAMMYRQLANEIVAFIRALDLRKPLIGGFSDGG
jgi:pimeloyl-ACP methyl ester carboxylesterase